MRVEKKDVYGSASFVSPDSEIWDEVEEKGKTDDQKFEMIPVDDLEFLDQKKIDLRKDELLHEVLDVYVLVLREMWKFKKENEIVNENETITITPSLPVFISIVSNIINSSDLNFKNEISNIFLIYFQSPIFHKSCHFITIYSFFNFYNFEDVKKLKLDFLDFINRTQIEEEK